jgi:phospholipid/cholesterol/gamma-HCH transport system substrate-binding protein
MPDEIKNGLIGLFVIAGLAILVFIILFLHPQTGDEGQTLYVRFTDIDKVNVGTRVTFAGRPVGEVVEIRDVPSPREERFVDDWIYPYELVLKIDSKVRVYNSDQISARTSGLLGERSVAITPKHAKPDVVLVQVTDKDVLFATDPTTIEEVFDRFTTFANKADNVLDGVMEQLDEIKNQKIWPNLGKTAQNIADITTALNIPTDWKDTLTNAKSFTQKADTAAGNFITFSQRLNEGEGTMNRLINNDDLYLRATAFMSKADVLMDDINHYGVLFHNDKGWQRLRARRMNLLQKLQSPAEFRNYFNDEIDMISTSLTRVSTVLEETFCLFPPEELLCDRNFESLFADLLRRISGLEESIKMYHQQMMSEYERSECCH